MKDKERLIIESSIKLFATRGYNDTSVQDIVEECEMSKGAFYLYFKSKDALLLATLKYYYDLIYTQIAQLDLYDLKPREKFTRFIFIYFKEIEKHKDFITILFKEQAIPFNEEIQQLVEKMGTDSIRLYHQLLYLIYGEKIQPYLVDLCCIVEGIFHSFLKTVILQHNSIDYKHFSEYFIERIDDIVDGIIRSGKKPIFSNSVSLKYHDLLVLIQDMRKLEGDEDFSVSLDVIESELQRSTPRIPVIKGMLTNLEGVEEARVFVGRIREVFSI